MKKKRNKMTHKSRILIVFSTLFGVFFLSMISPFLGAAADTNFKYDTSSEQGFGQQTSIRLNKRTYNPKTKLMKFEFLMHGSESEGEDINADAEKELANLAYTSAAATKNISKLKTKLVRVNDQYVVVYAQNVPSYFDAISVTLTAQKIDKRLPSDVIKSDSSKSDFKFYSLYKQVVVNQELDEKNKTQLVAEYNQDKSHIYQKQIDKLKKQNEELNADRTQNNKLIEQSRVEMENETATEKQTTESKIADYQNSNETDKSEIAENNKQIKELNSKIELLSKQNKN